ncbi:hypothetical protein H6A18_09265 [Collinsella tanakaei]|uniref:hypothetical protein n=1 Tax=Collinsella tanakaei TaxID=626935 RepID=UPI00195C2B6E|nr:hypothetical protein [Collinsella tanakaei]MBM6756690.1 hypothetical protein [Collinsella tanakaei]
MAKFITLENLTYFLGKVKGWVTGLGYQTSEQVNTAITGATAKLATKEEVTSATADMATKAWVGEQGYQTASQVESAITGKGYQTAGDVSSAISAATADMATQTWVGQQGFQNSSQVESAITAKGYDTASSVDGKVAAAKSEMQSAIDAAVSSVYEPKGSVAFASLPSLAAGIVGDVYNVTDGFTTTENFIEGAGKKYPAGTNVVCVTDGDAQKWDVLAGMVDLSGYVQTSDLEAVTNPEIDAMFD